MERHLPAQRLAGDHLLDDLAGPGLRVRQAPVGHLVARRREHRARSERTVGELRVERVVDVLLAVLAADDLELVLHPGALGELRGDVPQVGVADPPQRQRVGQADHPVPDQHLVGLAAPQERRPGALDDRSAVPLQEPVDRGRRRGAAGPSAG